MRPYRYARRFFVPLFCSFLQFFSAALVALSSVLESFISLFANSDLVLSVLSSVLKGLPILLALFGSASPAPFTLAGCQSVSVIGWMAKHKREGEQL